MTPIPYTVKTPLQELPGITSEIANYLKENLEESFPLSGTLTLEHLSQLVTFSFAEAYIIGPDFKKPGVWVQMFSPSSEIEDIFHPIEINGENIPLGKYLYGLLKDIDAPIKRTSKTHPIPAPKQADSIESLSSFSNLTLLPPELHAALSHAFNKPNISVEEILQGITINEHGVLKDGKLIKDTTKKHAELLAILAERLLSRKLLPVTSTNDSTAAIKTKVDLETKLDSFKLLEGDLKKLQRLLHIEPDDQKTWLAAAVNDVLMHVVYLKVGSDLQRLVHRDDILSNHEGSIGRAMAEKEFSNRFRKKIKGFGYVIPKFTVSPASLNEAHKFHIMAQAAGREDANTLEILLNKPNASRIFAQMIHDASERENGSLGSDGAEVHLVPVKKRQPLSKAVSAPRLPQEKRGYVSSIKELSSSDVIIHAASEGENGSLESDEAEVKLAPVKRGQLFPEVVPAPRLPQEKKIYVSSIKELSSSDIELLQRWCQGRVDDAKPLTIEEVVKKMALFSLDGSKPKLVLKDKLFKRDSGTILRVCYDELISRRVQESFKNAGYPLTFVQETKLSYDMEHEKQAQKEPASTGRRS